MLDSWIEHSDKVYVSNWMQYTPVEKKNANFTGSLKVEVSLLMTGKIGTNTYCMASSRD
jgi:hypothetical protein